MSDAVNNNRAHIYQNNNIHVDDAQKERAAKLRGNLEIHDAYARKLLALAGKVPSPTAPIIKSESDAVSPNSVVRMTALIRECEETVGVHQTQTVLNNYRAAIERREIITDGDRKMLDTLHQVEASWKQERDDIIHQMSLKFIEAGNAIRSKNMPAKKKLEEIQNLVSAQNAIISCLNQADATSLKLSSLPAGLCEKLSLPGKYLSHVTNLELIDVGLKEVPAFVGRMRDLTSLSLFGNNGLARTSLDGLEKLRSLDLSMTNVKLPMSKLPPCLSVLKMQLTPAEETLKYGLSNVSHYKKEANVILHHLRQMNGGMGLNVVFANDTLTAAVNRQLNPFPSLPLRA